jgi:murein endopeptidase
LLIHEETSEALDVLYGAFFDLNATLDRVASVMLNDFSMPNAGEIVHLNISHTMPLLADVVSEIKDNYNLSSIRPEVHKDDRNYSNLSAL